MVSRTGTSLRSFKGNEVSTSFDIVDNVKVSNIVEVCHVSVDEATSVLMACRMDETLAIERFLAGEVKPCAWSEVSKKKKNIPVRPRITRVDRIMHREDYKLGHDMERRRVKRSSETISRSTANHATPVIAQAPNSQSAQPFSASPDVSRSEGPREVAGLDTIYTVTAVEHSLSRSKLNLCSSRAEERSDSEKGTRNDSTTLISNSTPRLTNFASVTTKRVGNIKESGSCIASRVDGHNPSSTSSHEPGNEPKSKERGVSMRTESASCAPSGSCMASEKNAIVSSLTEVDIENGNRLNEPTPNLSDEVVPTRSTFDQIVEKKSDEGWSDILINSKDDPESNVPDLKYISLPNRSSDESGDPGNRFVLQFGSFGLSSVESVNWATISKSTDQNVVVVGKISEHTSRDNPDARFSKAIASDRADNSKVDSSCLPKYQSQPEPVPVLEDSEKPVASTSNGIPPVGLVGTTAAFPSSYAPYLVQPPVPYASGANSFDGMSDSNANRHGNMRQSVPVYDPGTVCQPPVSSNTKLHVFHRTSDSTSGLPVGLTSKGPTANVIVETDKPSAMSSGLSVPAGLDPISAPYVIPGYPYLLQGYPSLQYAPPGIAPHGPGHYTYAAVGQVSNPTFSAYHAQNSNMNKMNTTGSEGRGATFDDNAPSALRSGSSTVETPAFGPESYMSSTDNAHSKSMSDNPPYKNIPHTGGPANSFGSVLHNIPPGAPIGNLPYDYSVAGQSPGHAQLSTVGNLNSHGWGSSQMGSGRAEGNNSGGYHQLNGAHGYYSSGYY